MRILYLARHGRVDFPGGVTRCIGRTEVPLSEEGRNQARELCRYFSEYPVDHIYSSPMGRCVETADLIADGRMPVKIEKGLSEIYMGEWENRPLKELHKGLESEPEYGEGRAAALRRFEQEVGRILNETKGNVLCVAHAGINCCFLSKVLGTPLETSRALPQPYGGISRILVGECGDMKAEEIGMAPVREHEAEYYKEDIENEINSDGRSSGPCALP